MILCVTVVMPPDEWAYNVNNSAFTNMVATQSLLFGAKVARMCQLPKRANNYYHYAEQIYIPFNDTGGYHPEYDGYTIGMKLFTGLMLLCCENSFAFRISHSCKELISSKAYFMNISSFIVAVHSHVQEGATTRLCIFLQFAVFIIHICC